MGSIRANHCPSHSRGHGSQVVEVESGQRLERICFVGAGYVGAASSTVMAAMHPALQVDVVDRKANLINAWNSKTLPILEPGLDDLLLRGFDGKRLPNINFSTEISKCIKRAQMIFLCVETPSKNCKFTECEDLDMTALNAAVLEIAEASTGHKIIVEKSTAPYGTAERLSKILETKARPGATFSVISNPEFLAQGTALRDLLQPNRVVIGWVPGVNASRSVDTLSRLYSKWVPQSRIITMNAWSSELSKIVSSAFIAQRISSINSISAICEAGGADVDDISKVVGMEPRVGSNTLKAGFGFGGSCLRKDVLCLVYLSKSLGLNEVAAYWRAVHDMNEYQNSRISRRVLELVGGGGIDKKIAVFGFTYKRNTSDTRGSSAIQLTRGFVERGARVAIYDPHVTQLQMQQDLGIPEDAEEDSRITLNSSPYEAVRGASALLIHTDWKEFGKHGDLEWSKILEYMEHPKILLCPFQRIDQTNLKDMGFNILKIGKSFDGDGVDLDC